MLRVTGQVVHRRIGYAATDYLETRGTPQHPDDLVHHECLVMRYGLMTDRDWPFLIDGKERRVRGSGHRRAQTGPSFRGLACGPVRIARKTHHHSAADLPRRAPTLHPPPSATTYPRP